MARRRKTRVGPDRLLNDSAEPVFVLNAERELIYFNGGCEELTGWPSERALGLRCRYQSAGGAHDLPDLGASLGPPPQVFQGEACSVQSLFLRPDGQRLSRRVHFFPCHDSDGNLLGVVGIVTGPGEPAVSSPDAEVELHEGVLRLREVLYKRFGFDNIVSSSAAMHRALDQARLASQSNVPVLIWGEPATGKSLLARAIHRASERRAGRFLQLDCGAVPPEILERDLFGVESGGVTSPRGRRQGLLHSAGGGTLYLRNLSRMPRDVQSKLAEQLKTWRGDRSAVQAGDTARVGIIAADTLPPEESVVQHLRSDLFFMLSTITIAVPPLRERREDLPLLAQICVEAANSRGVKQVAGLSPDGLDVLLGYEWPGNMAELNHVIDQAHAACQTSLIEAGDITPRIRGAWGGVDVQRAEPETKVNLDAILQQTERRLIEDAMQRSRGNKSKAAELLSISRPRLYRRMIELGMDGEENTDSATSARPE